MLFRTAYLLFAFCCVALPSKAAPILTEDFEDGVLDPRISVQTVGTFSTPASIQNITDFGRTKAFGFIDGVAKFVERDEFGSLRIAQRVDLCGQQSDRLEPDCHENPARWEYSRLWGEAEGAAPAFAGLKAFAP
jgi:hypothetical protein